MSGWFLNLFSWKSGWINQSIYIGECSLTDWHCLPSWTTGRYYTTALPCFSKRSPCPRMFFRCIAEWAQWEFDCNQSATTTYGVLTKVPTSCEACRRAERFNFWEESWSKRPVLCQVESSPVCSLQYLLGHLAFRFSAVCVLWCFVLIEVLHVTHALCYVTWGQAMSPDVISYVKWTQTINVSPACVHARMCVMPSNAMWCHCQAISCNVTERNVTKRNAMCCAWCVCVYQSTFTFWKKLLRLVPKHDMC